MDSDLKILNPFLINDPDTEFLVFTGDTSDLFLDYISKIYNLNSDYIYNKFLTQYVKNLELYPKFILDFSFGDFSDIKTQNAFIFAKETEFLFKYICKARDVSLDSLSNSRQKYFNKDDNIDEDAEFFFEFQSYFYDRPTFKDWLSFLLYDN